MVENGRGVSISIKAGGTRCKEDGKKSEWRVKFEIVFKRGEKWR